jgi:pyrroline-5-carboxylate reductase
MDDVLSDIKGEAEGKLFVSIAAGVKIEKLEGALPGARVIRVMPNSPAAVSEMAAAYAPGATAGGDDEKLVERVLNSLGTAVKVEEEMLDAVTGLSGSGPAYIYYIIRALADAGVSEGLPEDVALKLAAQTVKGAGEMVLKSGKGPKELIDLVTSPGGTTVEGMSVLESEDVDESFKRAVTAATMRSRELSK